MITVLMVNYFSSALVQACIAELPTDVASKIVVLDNSVNADEWDALSALASEDDRLVLVRSSSNIGFGAAMNKLVGSLGGEPDDVLWLLNPDTVVLQIDGRAVERALSEQFDILSPVLTTGEDRQQQKIWFDGGSVDVDRGTVRHHNFGEPFAPEGEALVPTEFITGAAPLLRKSTYERLGGFDERLFLYWEDVDLSLRAASIGLRLGVLRTALVWHLEGGSSGGGGGVGFSSTYYRFMARNRLLVMWANGVSIRSALLGRGTRESLLSVLRPLIKESRGRMPKTLAAIGGFYEGVTIHLFGGR